MLSFFRCLISTFSTAAHQSKKKYSFTIISFSSSSFFNSQICTAASKFIICIDIYTCSKRYYITRIMTACNAKCNITEELISDHICITMCMCAYSSSLLNDFEINIFFSWLDVFFPIDETYTHTATKTTWKTETPKTTTTTTKRKQNDPHELSPLLVDILLQLSIGIVITH